jgi:hypothetical protein
MSYHQKSNSGSSDIKFTVPGQGEITIEIKWKVLNSRQEVAAITIEPMDPKVPFEAVLLRKIPWTRLIDNARKDRTKQSKQPTPNRQHSLGPDSTRTLTDDDLRSVADLYLQAWKVNMPVQRHVADVLQISIPTAARRISLARQRGFISREINPPKTKKDH